MSTFKIGILGPGMIANRVADTIEKMDGFQVYAVASRSEDRAKEFAKNHRCEKFYSNYEDLASDKDVDLIYITTPHSHHYEQTMMCLNAGKPCLVEKSFSYNYATAKEMIELAEKKHVFLGEAYWSRYNPMYHLLKETIDKGLLGRLHSVTVNMGYDLKGTNRITNPALAGGALLDIGIYSLGFATYILGNQPVQVLSSCAKFGTGVDAQNSIILLYPNGLNAHVFTTAIYGTERNAFIYGEKGYIKVNEILCPTIMEMYSSANELISHVEPPSNQISGFEYEFLSARAAIEQGMIEPKEMPHSETLALMNHMDQLRLNWGVKYPFE